MASPFSDEQIAVLSREIDEQLRDLAKSRVSGVLRHDVEGLPALPERQRKALEKATGEEAGSFLQKFKRSAWNDLCREGGVLYAQWQKWGDLSNEKVLKTFGGVLALMGLSGNALQVAAVALAVIVIHIGIKAICEEEEG